MKWIATRWGLVSQGSPFDGNDADADIEALSHELAHALDLRLDPGDASDWTSKQLQETNLSPLRADAHEIRACAVEVVALRRLNFPITVEPVAAYANHSIRCVPSNRVEHEIRRRMQRPDVQALADRFVEEVRAAAEWAGKEGT